MSNKLLQLLFFMLQGLVGAKAQKYALNQSHWRQCLEVMGTDSWMYSLRPDAPMAPAITLHFSHVETADEDPIVSVAIFHKTDGKLGGIKIDNQMHYVCDGVAIEAGVCEESEYGTFIGRLIEASYPIMTRAVHIAQFPEPVIFPITRSGVYCVETLGYTAFDFSASMRYDSKYGGIPAIQVGKWRFTSFVTFASLAALIATTLFYYGTDGNRVKSDFYRVLMTVFWLVTIQSAVAWANLTYINQHYYQYACQTLRGMAIFLVALRNMVIVYLVLESARATKQSNTRERPYHYVFYAVTFAISTARESELLTERDESRDKVELVWTLVSSVIMLLYHVESLQKMSASLSWQKMPRNVAIARWISVLLVIFILAFTIINVTLLWSWSVADEYGHDLLTKLWWFRWFLIDEWQTTVYLADIALAIFAWSAALEDGEESSTLRA